MAEVVNLKRFRKKRVKMKKDAEATENATKYGLSKAQKQLNIALSEKADSYLDGHKRDDDD